MVPGRGRGRFSIEIPRRGGGGSPTRGGGARGREGVCGAKYFFSGPKCPPSRRQRYTLETAQHPTGRSLGVIPLAPWNPSNPQIITVTPKVTQKRHTLSLPLDPKLLLGPRHFLLNSGCFFLDSYQKSLICLIFCSLGKHTTRFQKTIRFRKLYNEQADTAVLGDRPLEVKLKPLKCNFFFLGHLYVRWSSQNIYIVIVHSVVCPNAMQQKPHRKSAIFWFGLPGRVVAGFQIWFLNLLAVLLFSRIYCLKITVALRVLELSCIV